MERRDFLKNTAAVGIALAASGGGTVFAGSKKKERGKDKEYQRLQNRDNPTVLEQKHVPAIEVPSSVKAGEWFDVKVKVGFQAEHPSVPEHWITMIKLNADGEKLAKVSYPEGGVTAPVAMFSIKLEKTAKLEAVEHCNLHGTWISEPVTVTVS